MDFDSVSLLSSTELTVIVAVVVVIISVALAFILPIIRSVKLKNINHKQNGEAATENSSVTFNKDDDKLSHKQLFPNGSDLLQNESASRKKGKPVRKDTKTSAFQHKWLACLLKGHGAEILDMDFSPNGKYLVSCDSDRSCFIWYTKDWGQKKNYGSTKVLMDLDHASHVVFSPDSKAFIVALLNSQCIKVYKISKPDSDKKGLQVSSAFEFQHSSHAEPTELISMGIASNGRFIMTCYSDTTLKLWTLKGDFLCKIDTCHMTNNMALVSPCGRFVASCGFTPDVKVWEVVFDKSGNFVGPPARVFELKGHNAQVSCISFNANATRMASVSEDSTWKVWDIDVRYKQGQDPILLITGSFPGKSSPNPARISLSPDARVLALTVGSNLLLYSTSNANGEPLSVFEDVHSGGISKVAFDSNGHFLVSCGGDRCIPVIHNVPGLEEVIRDCSSKVSKAQSRAQKEMLQQEMDSARTRISSISQT